MLAYELGSTLVARQVVTLAQAEAAKRYGTRPSVRERSGKDLGEEEIPVDDLLCKLQTAKRLQGPMLFPRDGLDEEMTQLLVRHQAGDQLWKWRSPPATWRMLIGRGGITLVRDNRPLATVLTVMN